MVRYGWYSNKMRGVRHQGLPPVVVPPRPGAPRTCTYEPCDDVDPTPDYENVLTTEPRCFPGRVEGGFVRGTGLLRPGLPQSRYCSRIAWSLGRCRPPTLPAMGQNREKLGIYCLLTHSAQL